MRVLPEGYTMFTSSALLIQNADQTGNLLCEIPPDAVENSTDVQLEMSGNLLGIALNSLRKLSDETGNLLPTILLLKQLNDTNQLSDELMGQLSDRASTAYQKQLLYRGNDGSFESFIDELGTEAGPIYSTAITARSLFLAREFIDVDETIIDEAVEFLANQQQEDGGFEDPQNLFGLSKVSLTAFVVIAVTDLLADYPELSIVLDDAQAYLVDNSNSSDPYSLSLTTYVLWLAMHEPKKLMIQTADENSWNIPGIPDAQSIEMLAYTLLSYANSLTFNTKAAKILENLITDQSIIGGFWNSRATIVGLEAIMRFTSLIQVIPENLNLTITPDVGGQLLIKIVPEDGALLQKVKVRLHKKFVQEGAQVINTLGKSLDIIFLKFSSLIPRVVRLRSHHLEQVWL